MKIKIYQINRERDKNNLLFMTLKFLEKKQSDCNLDSSIYDCVFEGKVDCKTLEDVFRKFNTDHPTGYKARSLSVSDVVEVIESDKIKSGFYFCDSFGFKEINFEPSRAEKGDNFCKTDDLKTISVLFVKPNEAPKMVDIEDSLEGMQKIVGGDIESYMPFDDEVAIICNEEGKISGLPLNRAIYSIKNQEVDLSYYHMKAIFREVEKSGKEHIKGYITFTKDSFEKPYTIEERTYEVSSDNKAFRPNMGGYSIFGSSIDGSDPLVRLENYMADERGGKDGWRIERCYMNKEVRTIQDVIAGPFFVAYAPVESENFQSLPKNLADKYMEKFKYPERFSMTNKGIKAEIIKPKSKDLSR